MLGKFKNSKKQGDHALGIAIGWFCAEGLTVSVPLTDSQDYDLVVEWEEKKLIKVQVKSTTHKTKFGIYNVGLSVKGGNRTGTGKIKLAKDLDYDYLFVLCDYDHKYLIPKVDIANIRSGINLGPKYAQYRVS